MRTNKQGDWRADTDACWTDESLPMDVRRGLLDRELERIKASKGLAHAHPASHGQPDHPGQSGSESSGHNDQ